MEITNQELHRIVATAIIIKNNKVLIVKRSADKKAWPNLWTVPGGGLETSDYINTPKTFGDCWYFVLQNVLAREVKEEVGLEIGKINYLLDLVFIRPDNVPVITLSFYCPYQSGEVRLNEENVDFAWVGLKEAKNYELIPGILEEIEMVYDILGKPQEQKIIS